MSDKTKKPVRNNSKLSFGFLAGSLKHRKKTKLFLCCFLLIAVYFIFFKSAGNRFSSIIACKKNLAKIAIPNEEKRHEYLAPVGIDYATVEDDFFHLISAQMTNCKSQEHLGPPEDGGWEVCLEPRYDIHPPCLVYSFGVSEDFKFEKDAERLLKCQVHAFDPSLGLKSFQPADNIFFHDYGLDNVETIDLETGWKLKRLVNIMKELGHQGRTIDYLKMDVEFSEWLVLNDLLSSNLIHHVRQLSLEIHTPEVDVLSAKVVGDCATTQPDTLAFMFRTLVDLRNAGLSLYHSRTNHRISYQSAISAKTRFCCHNLHFVNNKHAKNSF